MTQRKIIIEPCPVGFLAMRDEWDLGDKIGDGRTPQDALQSLLDMEAA